MACGEPSFGGKIISDKHRKILITIFAVLLTLFFFTTFYGKINLNDKKQAQCRICQYGDEEKYKVEYWNESQRRWMLWVSSPHPNNITLREDAESILESCIDHYKRSKKPTPKWRAIKELYE